MVFSYVGVLWFKLLGWGYLLFVRCHFQFELQQNNFLLSAYDVIVLYAPSLQMCAPGMALGYQTIAVVNYLGKLVHSYILRMAQYLFLAFEKH